MPFRNPAVLQLLLARNTQWADRFKLEDPELLKQLAGGQKPKVFWIGCSDSRVPESVVTDAKPGEIFVHRNIANSFPPNDDSSLASLTFAVNHLGVDCIVVCGHLGCGGIKAAYEAAGSKIVPKSEVEGVESTEGEEALGKWLAPIRSLAVSQLHSRYTSALDTPEALRLLVESHVSVTVSNIAQSSVVKAAWKRGVSLSIHAWVYDIANGKIKDLGVTYGVDKEEGGEKEVALQQ